MPSKHRFSLRFLQRQKLAHPYDYENFQTKTFGPKLEPIRVALKRGKKKISTFKCWILRKDKKQDPDATWSDINLPAGANDTMNVRGGGPIPPSSDKIYPHHLDQNFPSTHPSLTDQGIPSTHPPLSDLNAMETFNFPTDPSEEVFQLYWQYSQANKGDNDLGSSPTTINADDDDRISRVAMYLPSDDGNVPHGVEQCPLGTGKGMFNAARDAGFDRQILSNTENINKVNDDCLVTAEKLDEGKAASKAGSNTINGTHVDDQALDDMANKSASHLPIIMEECTSRDVSTEEAPTLVMGFSGNEESTSGVIMQNAYMNRMSNEKELVEDKRTAVGSYDQRSTGSAFDEEKHTVKKNEENASISNKAIEDANARNKCGQKELGLANSTDTEYMTGERVCEDATKEYAQRDDVTNDNGSANDFLGDNKDNNAVLSEDMSPGNTQLNNNIRDDDDALISPTKEFTRKETCLEDGFAELLIAGSGKEEATAEAPLDNYWAVTEDRHLLVTPAEIGSSSADKTSAYAFAEKDVIQDAAFDTICHPSTAGAADNRTRSTYRLSQSELIQDYMYEESKDEMISKDSIITQATNGIIPMELTFLNTVRVGNAAMFLEDTLHNDDIKNLQVAYAVRHEASFEGSLLRPGYGDIGEPCKDEVKESGLLLDDMWETMSFEEGDDVGDISYVGKPSFADSSFLNTTIGTTATTPPSSPTTSKAGISHKPAPDSASSSSHPVLYTQEQYEDIWVQFGDFVAKAGDEALSARHTIQCLEEEGYDKDVQIQTLKGLCYQKDGVIAQEIRRGEELEEEVQELLGDRRKAWDEINRLAALNRALEKELRQQRLSLEARAHFFRLV